MQPRNWLGLIFTCLLCLSLAACWRVSLGDIGDLDDARGKSFLVRTPLTANGGKRTYRLHVPANWDGESPLPVVLVLHGAFMTAKLAEEQFGFTELSDREGFLVIYPNAMNIYGILQHWNAGFCCGKAQDDRVNDVHFLDWCLGDVATRFPIDGDRVYMVGFSNGGMLAFHYAAERPTRFAGIGVVASGLPEDDSLYTPPSTTIPLCIIHGRTDANILYEGGSYKKNANSSLPRFKPTPKMARQWAAHNGCEEPTNIGFSHAGRVLRETWDICSDNDAVTLYTIENFGHRWPGDKYAKSIPTEDGRPLNGAELLWEFFENNRKRRAP